MSFHFKKTSFIKLFFISILSLITLNFQAQANIPTNSFADLVEELTPSVVNISTVQNIEQQSPPQGAPQFPEGSQFDDFFKEFFDRFGQYQNQPRQIRSLGSGFIIDSQKKLIVTNNHLVQDADEVIVILKDGTEIKAEILGQDADTDLALLKIKTDKPLIAAKFGSSEKMRVGDWVLAIGNPFGLGGTVTAGIISASARDININPYIDFIQTDASINQGNSGGPMFNMNGEVIGINTAIFSPSGGSVGIGFAIPSDSAQIVIAQLEKYGKPKRAWLGVRIQDVTEDIAESLALKSSKGVLVGDVFDKSPAGAAGIKMGDVIQKFNNQDIKDVRHLQRLVAESDINSTVTLSIWRQNKILDVKVKLAELDQSIKDDLLADVEPEIISQSQKIEALELSVSPLTKPLRDKFSISSETQGVLITDIVPAGMAAEKGLHKGDVITEAGMMAVHTPKDLEAQIDRTKKSGRKSILLLIERQGTLLFIALPFKS